MDGRVDSRDIVAGLLSLARDGYLRLEKQESKTLGIFSSTDWFITILKPIDDRLLSAERDIVTLLFEADTSVGTTVLLDKVVTVFNRSSKVKTLSDLRQTITKDLIQQQYKEKF